MVIVDTNIIIDHLRLHSAQTSSKLMHLVQHNPKKTLAISTISVQELYESQSTKDSQKEQYLLATISPLKILPYTYEVAKLAGEIARDLHRPIELADAAIAATAIITGCGLATTNTKDFIDIPQLSLL
jgi:predicted nucleic acid-binding protein